MDGVTPPTKTPPAGIAPFTPFGSKRPVALALILAKMPSLPAKRKKKHQFLFSMKPPLPNP